MEESQSSDQKGSRDTTRNKRHVAPPAPGGTTTVRVNGLKPFYDMLKNYKEAGMDFRTTVTSNSRTIKAEHVTGSELYIFSNDHFPMGALNWIKKIRDEFLKNEDKILDSKISANPFDILYTEFSESLYKMKIQKNKTVFLSSPEQDVYEADISFCYYRAALNLGFISQALYDACIELPKKYRLKLLGTIATQKTVRYYEEGKMVLSVPPPAHSNTLRIAWHIICRYVDEAMQTVKHFLGENFLFYWTDGIYFTFSPKNPTPIEDFFSEVSEHLHFDWKIKKLHRLSINNDKGYLEIRTEDKPDPKEEDIRFFYPPLKKVVAYYSGTEEHFLNI